MGWALYNVMTVPTRIRGGVVVPGPARPPLASRLFAMESGASARSVWTPGADERLRLRVVCSLARPANGIADDQPW